jgi:hypothetical protein
VVTLARPPCRAARRKTFQTDAHIIRTSYEWRVKHPPPRQGVWYCSGMPRAITTAKTQARNAFLSPRSWPEVASVISGDGAVVAGLAGSVAHGHPAVIRSRKRRRPHGRRCNRITLVQGSGCSHTKRWHAGTPGERPTCVRGGGPPGRFDGLQRPECGQEIAGPGLAALRGDADVLNVVC